VNSDPPSLMSRAVTDCPRHGRQDVFVCCEHIRDEAPANYRPPTYQHAGECFCNRPMHDHRYFDLFFSCAECLNELITLLTAEPARIQ